jgi:hypothetical protein
MEHPDTLCIIQTVPLSHKGIIYTEAETLFVRVLAADGKKCGMESPEHAENYADARICLPGAEA